MQVRRCLCIFMFYWTPTIGPRPEMEYQDTPGPTNSPTPGLITGNVALLGHLVREGRGDLPGLGAPCHLGAGEGVEGIQ